MSDIQNFWHSLSRSARWGFGAGLLLIMAMVLALAWSVLRTPYGVLFSDLNQRDLAAVVAELDKQKTPYRLSDDGRSVSVPEDQVHRVRLSLMGTPLQLQGTVGFELFNNSDFAMTEFAQKVNYQRALQGELTRTILSLDEVDGARVHLALPEAGLFRKSSAKAKASVTLRLKPQRRLTAEQVQGIQRLVAASVNEVQAEEVTVLDERGVVLSRARADDGLTVAGSGVLDQKQEMEAYLATKAMGVLATLLGPGESLVSVDAVFERDQVRVTTEEILPAKAGAEGEVPTGVIVRERVSSREGAATGAGTRGGNGSATQETEFQVGRRTQQVVSPAGQLKRLQVAVVLRPDVPLPEVEKIRELVAAAVGLNPQRGDRIAVHAMGALTQAPSLADASLAPVEGVAVESSLVETGGGIAPSRFELEPTAWHALVALGAILLLFAVWLGFRRRPGRDPGPAALSAEQRQQVLLQVQDWLARDPASVNVGGKAGTI